MSYYPKWFCSTKPLCCIHVLWAESPPTVRTVAQVAAEAKPAALKLKTDPGAGYRLLDASEKVEAGDEWEGYRHGNEATWWCRASGSIGKIAGTMDYTYRRRLPALLCPIDPPPGYYILGPDSPWQDGDLIGSDDEWVTLHSSNFGTTTITWNRTTSPRWCCRKLPVAAPEYRPYADAAEAAAGLQGKLIRSTGDWLPVTRVFDTSVFVRNFSLTMAELVAQWKFTDGTPCGVPFMHTT